MINDLSSFLLRDIILPDILEKDSEEILYWEGKNLYKKFSDKIVDDKELINFFQEANFGNLEITKITKKLYEFNLSNEIVTQRINSNNPEFSIETGFLCEYVQLLTNNYCTSNIKIKSKSVIITIYIDNNSILN